MHSIIYLLTFVSIVSANILFDLSKEQYNEVKNSRNFTGKVVLVTGSSTGIGEGIVKLFSLLGAQVVVTGRNATGVKRVAQEVQQLSPKGLKVIFILLLFHLLIYFSYLLLTAIGSDRRSD